MLSWTLFLSSLRIKGDEQQTSHAWIQLCTLLWLEFDMVLFCPQQRFKSISEEECHVCLTLLTFSDCDYLIVHYFFILPFCTSTMGE